jgi:Ca2+-binding EF-hand superfamily protein
LRLRAARWQRTTTQGYEVLLSEITGPALLGVFKPRIVVPRWLLQQSDSTQVLILEHERQHMKARDPLMMVAGLFIIAVVPWNPFLWWQWRRMRHAMEMDCDARVLRTGAEPGSYAEVLLEVTQRATRVFPGALAMSEPVAALEQRIEHLEPKEVRHAALQTMSVLGLAAAGVGAALALEAPALPMHVAANLVPAIHPPNNEVNMNKSKSIAVAVAALGVATAAQAQTSSDELRIRAESILAKNDLNKDGEVTRDEATRANQPLIFMFDLYDRDRNGTVTATEIAVFTDAVELGTAVEKIAGAEAAAGLPKKASPQLIIANNDQNGDGIVTKEEAVIAQKALFGMWDQYDLNKDGKVDAAELAKASGY